MIHHVSFSVRDVRAAAEAVAALSGGQVVAAPSPPFPAGSFFVIFGDDAGSLIELTPWGAVHNPGVRGLEEDPDMRPFSASHVLVGSPLSAAEILKAATARELQASDVNAGLFKFVKVWIEDTFLLELLPAEWRQAYTDTFGTAGVSSLDLQLRGLEQDILRSIGTAA